jgi:hypothetical protein
MTGEVDMLRFDLSDSTVRKFSLAYGISKFCLASRGRLYGEWRKLGAARHVV